MNVRKYSDGMFATKGCHYLSPLTCDPGAEPNMNRCIAVILPP
jgi:hypothetical protein